ncbi:zinc finger protein 493 [Patella vulgata]|uniref:zinc finger protein 493 n=1 Tax=Patella vulgata TaxID=6465 RepID=UPI0024A8CE83|nr:zinc finger protein 493 [Patella vulgata]XP_055958645.1 zinc finger protein 493 [Patella vulgata]
MDEAGSSYYGIKDKDLNTIIKISEKLIESHTKSVNEIVSHCSEISGYGFHSNKILDHCNQIVSETLNCSYMVISLCQSFTKIDLTSSQLASLMNREKSGSFSTEEDMLISKVKEENNYCSSTNDAQHSVGMITVQSDKLSDSYMRHVSIKKNPLTISSYNRQTCKIVKEKTKPLYNLAVEGSSSTDDPASIVDMATGPHEVVLVRYSDQISNTIRNDKGKSSTDLHEVNTLKMDDICSKDPDFPVEGECRGESSNSLEINVLDWDKGISGPSSQTNSGSEFTCSVCSKTFKTETTFKKHKQYHNRYNFVCEVCNGRFAGKLKLRKHVLSQTDEGHVKLRMSSVFIQTGSAGMVFDVFEENESFEPTKVKLEENLTKGKVEKDERPNDDEIIDVVSEEPDFMLKRNEIEGRQTSPEVENQTYSDTDALEYDDNVNNDPDWHEVKELEDEQVCTNTFKKDKPFKRHKLSHQIQTNDFGCEVCDKHFDTKNKLKTHISKCHSKNIKTKILTETNKDHVVKLPVMKNSVRVKRQCEICGKQYKNLCHLRHHLKTHSGVKSFSCELCDYKGYTNQHLSRHMKSHSTDKNYQCDQCGKRFATNNNLKKHITTHNNVRSFSCHMCSKRFNDHGALTRHSKIHKHEQQHVCEICGKRSRQAYNITVHMRTHNGHKPFSCEICGKKFAHNVSLRQHKNSCVGKIEKI